ncbi:ATP synthase F1 subunit delta [Seonamhaeicola aphaedonensis]|uniref:ATP synthase subunit delta n=1 Tax=Seonamhaeicola aphaedonensis TaxID=1461338 RepID=A0A3D9HHD2_9FLAO|nr:ATP synthase F1 subunit delta [Seonamhaeicola aphaedonensis]RED48907.1 ATP synthase F1 subcomplex delta subunit [Seonamhaeicola aphaedonensis]
MAGTRAAIRYAKAALSLASDQKAAEAVNNDMIAIAKTISENEELDQVLKSSVVKTEVKSAVLSKIFPKLTKVSSSLFNLLIDNKRIGILGDVAQKYTELFDELNGKEIAQVTTAIPMTKALEIKVLAKVKQLTNKAVELENIVDESIIGGFILRIGDKQYNASVQNKLNRLKREFSIN